MKRGEPLKRTAPLARSGQPLARRTPLGRGNGHLARSNPQTGRKASAGLKRSAPKVKAPIPKAVREHVYAREEGKCIKCRRVVGRGLFERALHHVLPEREWPEYVKFRTNVVLVCAGCHDEHERAHRRIAIGDMPLEVLLWIATLPDGPALVYLERTYST